MFKEKSLKFKLLLSFGALSLIVITMTAFSLHSMDAINTKYGHIVAVTMPNVQAVGQMTLLVEEANRLNLRTFMAMNQNDLEAIERNMKDYPERLKDLEALNTQYRSTPFAPGEEEQYEEVWKKWKEYEALTSNYYTLAKAGITDQKARQDVTDLINENLRVKRIEIIAAAKKLIAFQDQDAKVRSESAIAQYKNSFNLLFALASAMTLGSAVLGYFFAAYMNKTLAGIADKIRNTADQTSLASHELTSASSQLSQGATESAASLEETVSSLEELSSMVKLNSDHAQEANTLSKKSLTSAELGEKEIHHLVSAMSSMSKSSKKIEEIINVIDDIAFQTNLLALNAAVEAARAGEQGRGFAVVADAVRNLAGRSAIAAKDINNLIKENVEMTESGVKIANTSGSTLKEIVESAKKVADLNAEISAASQEQANGIEQISKAMNHLDQAIQGNASSSEEVASSASEMSSQSDFLISMVHELKVFVEGGKPETAYQTQSVYSHETKKVLPMTKAKKPKDDDQHEIPFGKADGF